MAMRRYAQGERGAALVTVLLFLVLTLILITSMLTVSGNEVLISGLQRDGVRALELAQAGLQEAVRRMEEGHKYTPSFTSSLQSSVPGSTITVSVIRQLVGVNSAYQEIRSEGAVGRARRRLSMLVLQRNITFPPNITFAASVIEQGSAQITCGDAYARSYIQYKDYPSNTCSEPPTLTYAGWRVSKATPGAVNPCYSNAGCIAANPGNTEVTKWYPAHRRTEGVNTVDGADIAAQKNKCPAGGGESLPSNPVVGILASAPCDTDAACVAGGFQQPYPQYGFDTDDPDGVGGAPPQAVIPAVLPCGLPYKLVSRSFPAEDATMRTRLFKSVNFEQWFALYWRFDEAKMNYVKRNGSPCSDAYCLTGGIEPNLALYKELGAIPPFPDVSTVNANFDCRMTGGGTVNSLPLSCAEPAGQTSDLGCKSPQMACSPPVDRPVMFVFEAGDWHINGNMKGHGTIIVNGNLIVNGDFEFWGTIVVNGQLTLGAGSAIVHGGLVAESTLRLSGNITVEGGGTITNVPTGRSIITGRAWWER